MFDYDLAEVYLLLCCDQLVLDAFTEYVSLDTAKIIVAVPQK